MFSVFIHKTLSVSTLIKYTWFVEMNNAFTEIYCCIVFLWFQSSDWLDSPYCKHPTVHPLNTKLAWLHRWNDFNHRDVIKWKHFPDYWPFVRGIHRWRGALLLSWVCVWANGWTDNGGAGDLIRQMSLWRHCDVRDLHCLPLLVLQSFCWNSSRLT